jgi:hypothetical protein
VAILPLRKDAPNPSVYGGPEVAIKQRSAYPDIQTLLLNMPAPQAFEQALSHLPQLAVDNRENSAFFFVKL